MDYSKEFSEAECTLLKDLFTEFDDANALFALARLTYRCVRASSFAVATYPPRSSRTLRSCRLASHRPASPCGARFLFRDYLLVQPAVILGLDALYLYALVSREPSRHLPTQLKALVMAFCRVCVRCAPTTDPAQLHAASFVCAGADASPA